MTNIVSDIVDALVKERRVRATPISTEMVTQLLITGQKIRPATIEVGVPQDAVLFAVMLDHERRNVLFYWASASFEQDPELSIAPSEINIQVNITPEEIDDQTQ